MRTLLLPLVIGLAACASADSKYASADTTGSPSTIDTTGTTETAPERALPDSYAVFGMIQVVAGAIDLTTTELTIDTYVEGEPGPACSEPLTIASTEPAELPEGEPITGWWSVVLDTQNGCDAPTELMNHLGLGAYDSRLDVSLAAHELVGATAYGLYIQADDEPLWIVGVAGTAEQLAGSVAPDLDAPVPDGTYEVQALVLSPWPSP